MIVPHAPNRRTYVCFTCRVTNRTGGDCRVCHEGTTRLYSGQKVPQRHNDKAWRKMKAQYDRLRSRWERDNALVSGNPISASTAKPVPFDFGLHLREKRAKYAEPKPPKKPTPTWQCSLGRHRCTEERKCRKCKAKAVLAAMKA
jgi:hypothetical protein